MIDTNKWRSPPKDAMKIIDFGKLKGKTDINPQWRIDTLNETFGLCGTGWYYDVVEVAYREVINGVFASVKLLLYVKDGNDWSKPIVGIGGDMLEKIQKGERVSNDDAIKGAVTDALGNACKYLGIAGDVYRGFMETKYNREQSESKIEQRKTTPQKPFNVQEALDYLADKCVSPVDVALLIGRRAETITQAEARGIAANIKTGAVFKMLETIRKNRAQNPPEPDAIF